MSNGIKTNNNPRELENILIIMSKKEFGAV